MKKIIRSVLMALAALTILTGCALSPKAPNKASDLISNAKVQMEKKKSVSADTKVKMTIELMGQKVTVDTQGTSHEIIRQGLVEVTGSSTISSTLDKKPAPPIVIHTFIRPNPDNPKQIDIYSQSTDSDWTHQTLEGGAGSKLAASYAPRDMVAFVEENLQFFSLKEEEEKVGQESYYVLEGTIPGEKLGEMMGDQGGLIYVDEFLQGLEVKAKALYDAKTQLPAAVYMSLPEKSVQIQDPGGIMDVTISLEMVYDGIRYNAVQSITLPEEALAAPDLTPVLK